MDLQQSAVAIFKDLTAAIVSRKYAPGDGLKWFLKEGVFSRVVIFLSKYTLLAHTQMYECSDSAILFCHALAYAITVCLHVFVLPLAQCCFFGASHLNKK